MPGEADAQRHPRAGVVGQRACAVAESISASRSISQRSTPAGEAPRQRPVVGAVDPVEGVGERAVEGLALREHRGQQAQRGAAGGRAGGVGVVSQGQGRAEVIARCLAETHAPVIRIQHDGHTKVTPESLAGPEGHTKVTIRSMILPRCRRDREPRQRVTRAENDAPPVAIDDGPTLAPAGSVGQRGR